MRERNPVGFDAHTLRNAPSRDPSGAQALVWVDTPLASFCELGPDWATISDELACKPDAPTGPRLAFQQPASPGITLRSATEHRLPMSQPTEHKLPPFRSLLKSTEVEDPINICVHRPLAYAFVWSIFRTRITPNQVTLMAVIAGALAGSMFLLGTPLTMILGGAALWTSAILDGADGILARAKSMQSEFGRAVDGAADMLVAVLTVFPAFYHLWTQSRSETDLMMMGPALGLTAVHLWMYDFYKESYLRQTRLDRGGEGEDIETAVTKIEAARSRGPVVFFCYKHVLMPYLQTQRRIIRLLNPYSWREGVHVKRSQETVDVYRKNNRGVMRLWAVVSLAPHSYLMAICAMLDRLDIYLYIRLFGMNAVFFVAVFWQRRATAKTNAEFSAMGVLSEERLVAPIEPEPVGAREVLATEA